MFETSIQYWNIANGAASGLHSTKARYALLQAEQTERRRGVSFRSLRVFSDAVIGGLIDGFLAPRLSYRDLGKPA